MRSELIEAATRVIDSGCYINGPEVAAFEGELAETLGMGRVVGVSNGLDAIRLIIRAYIETGRLAPGDEVILPSNTYIATLLPVSEFGLKPVLAKPDRATFGLDWGDVLRKLTPKTKAVITVHLYGTPSWDEEAARRLRSKGVLIIEDNAQAIGAQILNPRTGKYVFTGALGDAAAFSFYPTKNVGALGDAGAVATADESVAAVVKALANYGSSRRYHNDFIGYNCRLDELQAAFLRIKLASLVEVVERRNERARLYASLIDNPAVTLPAELPQMVQVWHQYVVRTPHRDKLQRWLADHDVATDVHYPLALFDQKCYASPSVAPRFDEECRDITRQLSAEVLSLPIATASPSNIEHISTLINAFQP